VNFLRAFTSSSTVYSVRLAAHIATLCFWAGERMLTNFIASRLAALCQI